MSKYKYYLVGNFRGGPYEIYRSNPVYDRFYSAGLERARKNGSWTSVDDESNLIMDLWRKGDFDEEEDEITEEEALAYLAQWRHTGHWPGRP